MEPLTSDRTNNGSIAYVNFNPDIKLKVGLRKFAEWYRNFYKNGK